MFTELLFIPVGILVGSLSGFFGIGGGILLIPILLLSGLNSALTVATSLMFVFGTSLSGAAAHTKMNNVNWRFAVIIGTVGILLTQVSNRIQLYISGSHDWILNILYIMLLSYFAWMLFTNKKKEGVQSLAKYPIAAAAIIGAVVGFLSALLGVGGGFMIPPLLIKWLGFDSKKAIGTSLASVLFISLGGVLVYNYKLELNYFLGLCLIIGAFIGSPLGARMTAHYEGSEITQRLGILYIFALSSMSFDLLALVTTPVLEYFSLVILWSFLAYMLFNFYKRFRLSKKK